MTEEKRGPGRPPKQSLVGPADAAAKQREEQELVEGVKDVTGLSITDFKALTQSAERQSHPFEGYTYPAGKVEDTNGVLHQAAWVVAYVPPVAQDASNESYMVVEDYKMDEVITFGPYEGKKLEDIFKLDAEYARNLVKTGKQIRKPTKTVHNRALRDWSALRNYDVVFDREIVLKDGTMPNCAIVENPSLRAQLVYRLDERTGGIRIHRDYALLDTKQAKRLLNTYRMMVRPQLMQQKLIRLVTGEEELPEGTSLADALGEQE